MSTSLDSLHITSDGNKTEEHEISTDVHKGSDSIIVGSCRDKKEEHKIDKNGDISNKDSDLPFDGSAQQKRSKSSTNITPTKIPMAAVKNRILGIPTRSNISKQIALNSNRKSNIAQTPASRSSGLKSSTTTTNGRLKLTSQKNPHPSDELASRTSFTVRPCTKGNLPASNIVNNFKTPMLSTSTTTKNNNNSLSVRNRNAIFKAPTRTKDEIKSTVHKLAPRPPLSTMVTPVMPNKSRSSSIVSLESSTVSQPATSKTTVTVTSVAPPPPSIQRKGLAKFANPIECQRQFQTLSLKIRKLNEIVEAREKEQDVLQEKLDRAYLIGTGYAVAVQYLGAQLKLDKPVNLLQECENANSRIEQLLIRDVQSKEREQAIIDDFNLKLKTSNDLKDQVQAELDLTRKEHSEKLKEIFIKHQKEIDDLNGSHQIVRERLDSRIQELESDLSVKSSELSVLRQDYTNLKHNYDTLEESLTKDKDSRMKYAQERITQLQKDVESLTTVMEMRQERLHQLEKDNMGYIECKEDLRAHKEVIKSLNQQLESINAALDKKRDQYKKLLCENERIKQELELENKERRRIIMRTEQLEYVLNESCSSDNATDFNTNVGNSNAILSSSPRSQTFEAS